MLPRGFFPFLLEVWGFSLWLLLQARKSLLNFWRREKKFWGRSSFYLGFGQGPRLSTCVPQVCGTGRVSWAFTGRTLVHSQPYVNGSTFGQLRDSPVGVSSIDDPLTTGCGPRSTLPRAREGRGRGAWPPWPSRKASAKPLLSLLQKSRRTRTNLTARSRNFLALLLKVQPLEGAASPSASHP